MPNVQLFSQRVSNATLPTFTKRKLALQYASFSEEQRSDYSLRATEYAIARLINKCHTFTMPRTLIALRQLAPWRPIRGVTVSHNHVYDTLHKQINGSYSDDTFIEYPAFLLGKFDSAVRDYIKFHPHHNVGNSYILQVYISRGCPYLLITEDRERWRVARFKGINYPTQRLNSSDLDEFEKYHELKALLTTLGH
ncbi:hypothetical protein QTV44_002547 [Vibrio vulnificus]|nr:hypothetical protein [Vibrio vulnificus]